MSPPPLHRYVACVNINLMRVTQICQLIHTFLPAGTVCKVWRRAEGGERWWMSEPAW
jgi:hypothetical protein